jgi:hypothetical protein
MSLIGDILGNQKEQFKKAFKNPITYLVVVVIAYLAYTEYKKGEELEELGEFTVGKVLEYGRDGHSSRYVKYEYEINGLRYTENEGVKHWLKDCEETEWCIGKKYKVRYSTKDPENSRIYLKKPVDDSLPGSRSSSSERPIRTEPSKGTDSSGQ